MNRAGATGAKGGRRRSRRRKGTWGKVWNGRGVRSAETEGWGMNLPVRGRSGHSVTGEEGEGDNDIRLEGESGRELEGWRGKEELDEV